MSTRARYRKKPVVIEAMQFRTVGDLSSLLHWIESATSDETKWKLVASTDREDGWKPTAYESRTFGSDPVWVLEIPTLEGTMEAREGDYIIRGVAGEFYPCKPDIFAQTYEPVPEAPTE